MNTSELKLTPKQEAALRLAVRMRPDLFEKPSLWNLLRYFGWAWWTAVKLRVRRLLVIK